MDRAMLCSRTCLVRDWERKHGTGTSHNFWSKSSTLNSAWNSLVWEELAMQPYSYMWMMFCTAAVSNVFPCEVFANMSQAVFGEMGELGEGPIMLSAS